MQHKLLECRSLETSLTVQIIFQASHRGIQMQVVLLHAVLQNFCSQITNNLAEVKEDLHISTTSDTKKYSTIRKRKKKKTKKRAAVN